MIGEDGSTRFVAGKLPSATVALHITLEPVAQPFRLQGAKLSQHASLEARRKQPTVYPNKVFIRLRLNQ